MNSNKLVPNGVINVGSNQPETKSEQKKNIVEKPTNGPAVRQFNRSGNLSVRGFEGDTSEEFSDELHRPNRFSNRKVARAIDDSKRGRARGVRELSVERGRLRERREPSVERGYAHGHVKHYGPLALQDANRKVRECQTRSSAVLGARTITRAYAGDQKLANKVYQMLHSFAEDHRPAALLLLFQPWMEMTCLYAAYKRNCFVALDLWQCAKMRRSTCIPSSYYSSAVGSVTHGRIWPKRYVHTSRVRCQPA
jgi:hypothetical protein